MVPAWAGLCDYVPAGVPVKTPPGSGAAQTHASRVEWPQLRSNGIGVSPHGHHAAHRALWTSHLQNRSLCLHATGDTLRDLGLDPCCCYLGLSPTAAGMGDVRVHHIVPHLPAAPPQLHLRLSQKQQQLESAG